MANETASARARPQFRNLSFGQLATYRLPAAGFVSILHRASGFMAKALGDDRFTAARLVDEKVAKSELGPKTGRGFFDYSGDKRDEFETAKVRALLGQLRRRRES